jgi:hypothetical protein
VPASAPLAQALPLLAQLLPPLVQPRPPLVQVAPPLVQVPPPRAELRALQAEALVRLLLADLPGPRPLADLPVGPRLAPDAPRRGLCKPWLDRPASAP